MNTDSTPRRQDGRLRRILRRGAGTLFGLFILVQVVFFLFQELRFFESYRTPTGYIDKPSLSPLSEDDFIELDEARINYQKFLALTKPRKGTVFFLHGNRGSIYQCRWVIEPFLKEGYDVWIMDYRGFGKSVGRRSEAAMLADAQMVYKRILEQEDEHDIIVWGRSLGSGFAAYIASGNSPKALVLETPYWSLPDAVRHSHPYLLPFTFRYTLPTHDFLGNVNCPVYLIHGTADEKIYSQSSEKLERLCIAHDVKVHTRWISDGKHNLRSEPAFKTIVEEILK